VIRVAALSVLAAVALAGCATSHRPAAPATTATRTSTAAPSATAPSAAAPSAAAPSDDVTSPVAAGPTTTTTAGCPFISQADVQDTLGQRLDHTTLQSSAGAPVGCTFYPISGGALATSEHLPANGYPSATIVIQTFASETAAHNALAAAASTGGSPSQVTVAGGLVGETYQGEFYPPDGANDWICAFLKGQKLITVSTANTDDEQAAQGLANAIAAVL